MFCVLLSNTQSMISSRHNSVISCFTLHHMLDDCLEIGMDILIWRQIPVLPQSFLPLVMSLVTDIIFPNALNKTTNLSQMEAFCELFKKITKKRLLQEPGIYNQHFIWRLLSFSSKDPCFLLCVDFFLNPRF